MVATGIESPAQKTAERPKLVAVGGSAAPAAVSSATGANGASLGIMSAPPVVGTRPSAGGLQTHGTAGLPLHAAAAQMNAAAGAAAQNRTQPGRQAPAGAPVARMVPSAPAPQQAAENEYPYAGGYGDEQMEPPAVSRSAPQQAPQLAPRGPARPAPQPRGNAMYADDQAAEAAPQARKSLFGIVTGAIRGTLPAAQAGALAPSGRSEMALHEVQQREAPVRANVRQAAGDEVGIDIPAFLRRQSS